MKADKKANNLSFIVSSGPKLQEDPSVRSLIRQHAMRNVAMSRKKRGNYGRVNRLQLPVLAEPVDVPIRTVASSAASQSSETHDSTDPDTSELGSDTNLTEYNEAESSKSVRSTEERLVTGLTFYGQSSRPPRSLTSDYEAARSRFQVEITDLAMLTSFNVGEATKVALSTEPTRLFTLLGHSNLSYLHFIPSRYGSSDCLTAATDCLLEKARSILMPYNRDQRLELRLHSRALKLLQAALQDASTCMSSDVLCATQLLGLHELLDYARNTTWSHHIKGSVLLVKHRTAARFTSDFDKALFIGHIGPVVYKSLTTNKRCYFDDPQWIELYQSTVKQSQFLTDRSPLAISIRTQMFKMPGLWHDVHEAVVGSGLFDDEVMSELQLRCLRAHGDLLDWTADYNTHCMSRSLTSPSSEELAMRRELLGVSLECLIVTKRLLATVCDSEREGLEPEAQAVAQLILNLQKEPGPKYSWLFSGHEIGVAQSIIATRENWECAPVPLSVCEMRLASRERYVTWSTMIRGNEERLAAGRAFSSLM